MVDLKLLRIGRHFRLRDGLKAVIGRTHLENEQIMLLAREGTMIFHPSGFRGPVALLSGDARPGVEEENSIGRIIARDSQDTRSEYPITREISGGDKFTFTVLDKYDPEALEALRIGQNGI